MPIVRGGFRLQSSHGLSALKIGQVPRARPPAVPSNPAAGGTVPALSNAATTRRNPDRFPVRQVGLWRSLPSASTSGRHGSGGESSSRPARIEDSTSLSADRRRAFFRGNQANGSSMTGLSDGARLDVAGGLPLTSAAGHLRTGVEQVGRARTVGQLRHQVERQQLGDLGRGGRSSPAWPRVSSSAPHQGEHQLPSSGAPAWPRAAAERPWRCLRSRLAPSPAPGAEERGQAAGGAYGCDPCVIARGAHAAVSSRDAQAGLVSDRLDVWCSLVTDWPVDEKSRGAFAAPLGLEDNSSSARSHPMTR